MQPSDYEKRALLEIYAWKNPEISRVKKIMNIINRPMDKAGDAILNIPKLGDIIKKSIQGLISVCNDISQWSVRPQAILDDYRKFGFNNIACLADIRNLDLEVCDKVIGSLAAKYKSMALAEGSGSGFISIPGVGIAISVPALVAINLRAIGEYATYCGFDISTQQERLYALNILGFASSPTDASKMLAMAQLARIAQDASKKKAWKELEKHSFVKIIREIARILGIRLTKAKLAQIIPFIGAVVGGGFDAYFTSNVCDAAFHLYRERFLAEKYDPDITGGQIQ